MPSLYKLCYNALDGETVGADCAAKPSSLLVLSLCTKMAHVRILTHIISPKKLFLDCSHSLSQAC